jgi:hypothetical protein
MRLLRGGQLRPGSLSLLSFRFTSESALRVSMCAHLLSSPTGAPAQIPTPRRLSEAVYRNCEHPHIPGVVAACARQGSGRLPVQGPPDHLLSGDRCRTSLSLLAWYHGKLLAQKRGLCRMCAGIQGETSSGTEESTGSMPASDRSRSFVASSLRTGLAGRKSKFTRGFRCRRFKNPGPTRLCLRSS